GRPLAHSSILKPGGSLTFFKVALISSSLKPVGGGSVLSTCVPFCSLVSSPMNQSSGGCSQKSFLLESYDLSSCVLAPDANSIPATATAAAAATIAAIRGFHSTRRFIGFSSLGSFFARFVRRHFKISGRSRPRIERLPAYRELRSQVPAMTACGLRQRSNVTRNRIRSAGTESILIPVF